MSSILIVEDERDIADLVAHTLQKAGHATEIVASGTEALARVRAAQPDLMILDLMLPGMDGLAVCEAMRRDPTTAAVPIIMLTARADESDRVAGLELGADDYVTKPFSTKELAARVGALLRRVQRGAAPGHPQALRRPVGGPGRDRRGRSRQLRDGVSGGARRGYPAPPK